MIRIAMRGLTRCRSYGVATPLLLLQENSSGFVTRAKRDRGRSYFTPQFAVKPKASKMYHT